MARQTKHVEYNFLTNGNVKGKKSAINAPLRGLMDDRDESSPLSEVTFTVRMDGGS
jgi:hypothetical protein